MRGAEVAVALVVVFALVFGSILAIGYQIRANRRARFRQETDRIILLHEIEQENKETRKKGGR